MGDLAATEGARTLQHCSCGYSREVDVAAVAAELGPFYSLWDRRPPCPTCGGRTWFAASLPNGPAVFMRCVSDPGAWTAHLHKRCRWCGSNPQGARRRDPGEALRAHLARVEAQRKAPHDGGA